MGSSASLAESCPRLRLTLRFFALGGTGPTSASSSAGSNTGPTSSSASETSAAASGVDLSTIAPEHGAASAQAGQAARQTEPESYRPGMQGLRVTGGSLQWSFETFSLAFTNSLSLSDSGLAQTWARQGPAARWACNQCRPEGTLRHDQPGSLSTWRQNHAACLIGVCANLVLPRHVMLQW